jgi:hypothetical protein
LWLKIHSVSATLVSNVFPKDFSWVYFATNKFAYLNPLKCFTNHMCLDLHLLVFMMAANSIENKELSRMWEAVAVPGLESVAVALRISQILGSDLLAPRSLLLWQSPLY